MTDINKPLGLEMTIYSVGGTPLRREYKEFRNGDEMAEWYYKNTKPIKPKKKKENNESLS